MAPELAPAVYASVVGLAGGQLHTNRRGREDAGFEPIGRMRWGVAPSPDGLQVIGTF